MHAGGGERVCLGRCQSARRAVYMSATHRLRARVSTLCAGYLRESGGRLPTDKAVASFSKDLLPSDHCRRGLQLSLFLPPPFSPSLPANSNSKKSVLSYHIFGFTVGITLESLVRGHTRDDSCFGDIREQQEPTKVTTRFYREEY